MYILYGGYMTRSALVEQVMAECGVEYEVRRIDTARKEQLSPEFLEINPAGWVPALVTPEGKTLYETPAINLYLAEQHGTPRLAPAFDDPDRGLFLSGLFYIAGMVEPALKRYWFPDRYADGENDAEAVRLKGYEDAVGYFAVIENRLRDCGPFHLGERFSLVDLMTAYWSESFTDPGAISNLAAVLKCHELVYDRPKLRSHKYTQRKFINELYQLREKGEGVR
ncbi:MAG: glutathione S-transferase family protein [Rhizobiaceae bacterium]